MKLIFYPIFDHYHNTTYFFPQGLNMLCKCSFFEVIEIN